METPSDKALQNARARCELGFYAEATNILQRALDRAPEPEKPLLSSELAHTYFVRALMKDTLRVAEEALQSPSLTPNSHLGYVLQLQRGFALSMVKGDFDFGKSVCEGGLGKLLRDMEVEGSKATRVTASLLSLFHSFTSLAKAHRIHVSEQGVHDITPAYTSALCEHRLFPEAIRLSTSLTEAKKKEMFETLLEKYGSQMRDANRATLLFELGTLSTSPKDDLTSAGAIDKADELFKRCGHAFGHLDCERFRINNFLQKKTGLSSTQAYIEKTQELVRLVDEYDKLGYPTGVMRAVDNLKTFYYTKHLIDAALTVSFEYAKIADRVGNTLMSLHCQIQALGFLGIQTGNFGKSIQAIEQLYRTTSELKIPHVAGTAASLATLAYIRMNQRQPAIQWAKRCVEHWSCCSLEDLSNAKLFLLQARAITNGLTPTETQQELADLSREMELCVEMDISESLYQLAIAKLEVLSGVETHRSKFIGAEIASERSIGVLQKIMDLVENLPPELRGAARANAMQMKVTALLQSGKPRKETDKEEEGIVCLQNSLRDFANENMAYHVANTRQLLALCHIQILTKKISGHNLSQAYIEATAAVNLFESLHSVDMAASSNYWLAYIACKAWMLTNGGSIELDVVMDHCERAERWLRRKRSELSLLSSMDAIISKRSLSTDKVTISKSLYEIALEVCLAAEKYDLAWEWAQRSKARSVSDLLALDLPPTKDAEERARLDEKAAALLDRQKELHAQLQSVPADQRVIVRVELERLESEMDRIPVLAEILAVQQGRSLNLHQAEALLKNARERHGKSIALVDWIAVGDVLWMAVFSKSNGITCRRLNIKLSNVKAWLQENVTSAPADRRWREDDTDPDSNIHELSELVSLLGRFTKPDQLLVFSPTDILHSLPLHALHVDGRVLILRNPIVYAPSMTIFAQCVARTEARAKVVTENIGKPLVAAVYDERSPAGLAEQINIAAHAEFLGNRLCGRVLLKDQVTKPALLTVLPQTNLLHFHGHYHYDEADIQKQGLVLSTESSSPDDPGDHTSDNSTSLVQPLNNLHLGEPKFNLNPTDLLLSSLASSPSLNPPNIFTISDTLIHQFPSSFSPHVSLIACSSSLQSHTPVGDEPLGLPTAFLVSGASSVVGTLWPTRSLDGRVFAEKFYAGYGEKEGSGNASKGLWDIAEGLRRAVLAIRKDVKSSAVWYWGGFVVQGAWFFRTGSGSTGGEGAASRVGDA